MAPFYNSKDMLNFCDAFIKAKDKVEILQKYGQNVRRDDLKSLLQWAQDCKSFLEQGAMTKPTNLAKHALENATVTGKLQGMLLTAAIFLTAFAIYKSNKQDAPVAPRAREPKHASK